MKTASSNQLRKLVYAGVCLALCMVLPLLTGQIPEIGNMLGPMHIPVLLSGFICGGPYGLIVGFVAPLLRLAIFGMPPMIKAVPMAFELAAYGLSSGLLYHLLPRRKINIYVSLIGAMIIGRVVWGLAALFYWGVKGSAFTLTIFFSEAFLNAIPGIICHIILIPLIVMAMEKAKLLPDSQK